MTNLHYDGHITCGKYKEESINLTWLKRKSMAEISFSMEYRFDINGRW